MPNGFPLFYSPLYRLGANGFCVFQRQLVGFSSIPRNDRRDASPSDCALQGLLLMLGADVM